MDTSLMLFTFCIVAILAIAIFVIRNVKKKQKSEGKELDPFELLKDFTGLIVDLSTNALSVISASEYKSESQFRYALADIVADAFVKELKEADMTEILEILSEEDIRKFVLKVFLIYKKEIKITELFKLSTKDKVDEIENSSKPVTLELQGKTDITNPLIELSSEDNEI